MYINYTFNARNIITNTLGLNKICTQNLHTKRFLVSQKKVAKTPPRHNGSKMEYSGVGKSGEDTMQASPSQASYGPFEYKAGSEGPVGGTEELIEPEFTKNVDYLRRLLEKPDFFVEFMKGYVVTLSETMSHDPNYVYMVRTFENVVLQGNYFHMLFMFFTTVPYINSMWSLFEDYSSIRFHAYQKQFRRHLITNLENLFCGYDPRGRLVHHALDVAFHSNDIFAIEMMFSYITTVFVPGKLVCK